MSNITCISTSHPEFLALLKDTGLRPFQLELRVVAWQMVNATDVFPTKEQLLRKTFYQISPIVSQSDTLLDNFLTSQMKQLGVKVDIVGDLKRRFNIDSLGVADTLTKTIHIANQRNIDTLPEEVAHMIVMILGEHNSDINYLIKKSKDWSKYQEIYDQYMPVYQNELQVKLEVVAKMIAESTVEVYRKTGLDTTLLQDVYNKLLDILKTIGRLTLGELRMMDSFTYAKATSDKLAVDILSGKIVKDLLEENKIPNSFIKMNFQEAFEKVPHAKQLHRLITTKTNAKLTGSLALSKQGSIYRDINEQIHDLDYVVKTEDVTQVNSVIDELKTNGAVDTHFGVNNGEYYTKSILVPVEGYEIIVKERLGDKNSKWSGIIQDFSIVEKSTKKDIGKDTTKFLNLDFFMYTDSTVKKDFQDVTSWEDVFRGKIGLSSSNLIFGRKKDVRDYIYFDNEVNNEKAFSNKFTYFQKDVELELNQLVEDFTDNQGYVFPSYVDHVRSKIKAIGGAWLRSDKKGYYIQTEKHNVVESREVLTNLLDKLSKKFGLEWRFDSTMKAKGRFENGIVYINPNKATLDTAFHEFAHPFLLVLKKENISLYNRLVRGIKNEKTILERTKKLYPELSEEELLEEAIVESLGRKAVLETKVYGGAITQFIEWVKGIIKDLFGQEYSSFKDVAKMLSDEAYEKQLEVNSKTALYQVDDSTVEIYRNQLEGKTTQQKEVVERLIAINREVELNDTGDKYVTSDGIEYTRVSDELAKDDYYKFDKNVSEENKVLALQWGNEVDGIMRSVLLNQPLEEGTIDADIAQGIYDEFKKIKESYPDAIIIPQITFLNKKKGVAGTADIVVVHKDGKLEILDVKTSRYKFRKTPDPKALKYADSYNRHAAQLTMYRALAESMGFDFIEQGGLKILPIEFTVSEVNEVTGWKRPFDFIEHGGVEKLYEVYREGFEKSQFSDVMNNLKQVIQKKINKAKQEGKPGQVKALETILADIRSSIDIEGVNKFVNESYNTFFGTVKFTGYYKMYKDYLNKAQLEDDPLEMLAKIHEIEELINLYKDSVKELWKSYLNFKELTPLDDFQSDSTLDKLDKLQRMFTDMEQGFQDDIPRVVAKVLAKQVSPDVVEAIKENIKSKSIDKFKEKSPDEVAKMSFVAKQRYAFQKNQSEKMRKKLNELNEQFVNDKGEVDVEEAIYREIKFGGYKDVGIADRWLSPGISMPNTFLPTFILTIKKAFEEVRLKNMRFIPLAYQQFEKFAKTNKASKDLPHEFNKGLYTTRTVQQGEETKQVLTFVSPIDYNAFNVAKMKFNEQTKALSGAEKYKAVLKWEAENTQVRPDVHIEGVTKLGNLILIETKTELEERKKKELGEKGFQDWKASVTSQEMLRGEYRIPKLDTYRDDAFFKMDSNQQEYYKFLLTIYFDSQKKVPKRKEEDKFILPFIDKSTNDRLLQGEFWNTIKYKGQDLFMLMEEDMLKENVEKNKTIPVLYYNNSYSMDAKDVSTDLLHSIMRFKMASDRYSVQNKYVPLANNLLSLVQKTSPVESDTEGFKILDKAAKAVGITNGVNKYVKKHEQSNVVAMLESFIDTQIYGIARKDAKFKLGGVTVDTGKIADTIMSFASHTQIAVDPLTSLANSLNAQIQIAEEAFAGQFIDKKTWWEAQKYYNTHELDFIHDSLQPYNKSFISTLMDTYDAMQGEYVDEFGHKLTKSAFKAKMSNGIGFSMMHKGEHRAAAIMMLSLLNKQKVGDKTLFEIHKEQFEKNGKIELDFSTQTRLHAINKRLHGVYNKFDAPEIQRHTLGRLIIMYRKFLAPGLKRRFKQEGLDYELGDYTEGFYRQFYKTMFTDVKKLALAMQNKQGDMTPYELYNIRRAIFEHLMIITTGILSSILMAMGGFDDDDEKDWVYGALLYQVLRVNSELSIYGGIGDINNYLLPDFNEVVTPYKATSAAFTTIAKVQKLYSLAMGDAVNLIQGEDIARYKRDSGIFEKGDSKTFAALLKLIGISGKNMDTDLAVQTLALTKGIDVSKD